MTQEQLYLHLKSLGIPVAYSEFIVTDTNPAPTPPFITYIYSNNDDMMADNKNYVDIRNYQIELYTKKKDLYIEKLLEDKLKELNITYSKFESKIESEKLIQLVYTIQLI